MARRPTRPARTSADAGSVDARLSALMSPPACPCADSETKKAGVKETSPDDRTHLARMDDTAERRHL